MVVILMIFGCSMENANEGIDMYLLGINAPFTPREALYLPDIWINAIA
jgi:hypothetical protein